MKKIVIVTQNFPPEAVGGASRIYEMARELQRSSQVEVICSPPTYPFTKFPLSNKIIQHEDLNGIAVHRIWTYQPRKKSPTLLQRIMYYTFHSILSSLYLMRRIRGDTVVIVTNPPPTLLISTLVSRMFRKKTIIDMRDFWIDAAVSLGFIKNKFIISCLKKFEKYCLVNSEIIITNSMYIQKKLSEEHPQKKIKYVPFNVNLVEFRKIQNKIENELVYIGNIGTAQNLTKLIHAVSILVKEWPKIRLEIYGGGDEEDKIRRDIEELKLNQNIFMHKPVSREQIPTILSKSMIGIVPLADNKKLAYAIPTKTFEYLACEIPIIAYGTSDELKRVLSDASAGMLVEGKHDKLAEKIAMLLKDQELMEAYKKNGRAFLMKQNHFAFLEE
ncbi:MAG: glycosyltransferase family 4 protein [Nitrosarchaeum sp.]|nr:glycosyltransferase family 4 protein [Nitrosarchaeum sp.]